jgi:hypothetical protein
MAQDKVLEALAALRQDLEVQTAINIVEGINTVETLALLGHWMQRKRPPTPAEAHRLESTARSRWTEQVRQAIALAKGEPGGLDRSLPLMLAGLAPDPAPKPKARPKAKPSASRKKPRR